MPDEEREENQGQPERRSSWSGAIAFGLVSIRVSLYPATRTERTVQRMVSPAGKPLRREYYCPAHDEPVPPQELVRGFEVADGQFITVSDEELEAISPEKSREIDLRQFVPADQIPPSSFERAHFLVPDAQSRKAYRLLTAVLAETARAGIATFVMRGKEYLVAILSDGTFLRAETLRFADEVRTPAAIGLPAIEAAEPSQVNVFRRAIRELAEADVDPGELQDRTLQQTRELVEQKLQRNQDVIRLSAEERRSLSGKAEIIDLFEELKRSLTSAGPANDIATQDDAGGAGTPQTPPDESLDELTKGQLYERARSLGIEGRSQMNKPQLAKAIRRSTSPRTSRRKVG